jgi:phosphoribosylanthranilate isomerase
MHPRVKICGLTCLDDALAAVEAGADALGFVFHPASPRHVTPALVRTIVPRLPPFVARVGVFVDAPEPDLLATVRESGIDTLQLHGREPASLCHRLAPATVIKGFRVSGADLLGQLEAYAGIAWLLDTHIAGSHGGTGRVFDWRWAREAVQRGGTVILAGGLNPDNVAEAVATVRPYAVDVSSGVERAPGKKDPARMRAFVAAAKRAPG